MTVLGLTRPKMELSLGREDARCSPVMYRVSVRELWSTGSLVPTR